MRYCSNCGVQLSKEARFCTNCGTAGPRPGSSPVGGPAPDHERSSVATAVATTTVGGKAGVRRGRKLWIIAGILAVALLAGIGALALISSLTGGGGFAQPGVTKRIVTATQDYSLEAGQYVSIPVDIESGDTLSVSATTRGGLDIGVRIEGPSGQVLAEGRQQSRTYTVIAPQDGRYAVIIDNTYSLFTGKVVTVVLSYPQRRF